MRAAWAGVAVHTQRQLLCLGLLAFRLERRLQAAARVLCAGVLRAWQERMRHAAVWTRAVVRAEAMARRVTRVSARVHLLV